MLVGRCRQLLESGTPATYADADGCTLLHWAAINNRKELVE